MEEKGGGESWAKTSSFVTTRFLRDYREPATSMKKVDEEGLAR